MDQVTTEVIRLSEIVKQESLRTSRLEVELRERDARHESFREEIRREITDMKIELKGTVMKVGMLCGAAMIVLEIVLKMLKF